MSDERISDRHSRALDGLAAPADCKQISVRISAGQVAHSAAGQQLLVCLANLLGRMTDLVVAIDLDLPPAAMLVSTPQPAAATLPETLVALVDWAVGDTVAVSISDAAVAVDFQLCIGGDLAAPDGVVSLHAIANGWRVWVGRADKLPVLTQDDSANPLGPFFAASLLAGEVFKRARGITRGRWLEDFGYSLWTGTSGSWDDLVDGPPLAGRNLPPLYVVGVGAVGQGLINVIGAVGFGSTYVVSIDDDHHDLTNFNRCFVAGVADKKGRKIDAITRYRKLTGVGGFEHFGTINDYVRRNKPGLPGGLVAREAEDHFDCVISCVDKGTSRQDVQGLWPALIIGGSTFGLCAKTNVYDLVSGSACLGCHNPPERDGEQLRKVEQIVRSMSREDRRTYLAGAKNVEDILGYLATAEQCGVAGEADFRAFATDQVREFSVSFVSMAAATMLASRLFARLLFSDTSEFSRAPMTSMAFLNGTVEDGVIAVDPTCRRCGGNPAQAFGRFSPIVNESSADHA